MTLTYQGKMIGRIFKKSLTALLTSSLFLLLGCSGGGSSDSTEDVTPPTFTAGDTVAIDVNENLISAIILDVTDATVITYSIREGDDGESFDIDSETGEVTFKVAPDFEADPPKTSYTLTVVATDASDNEATQTVTITIVDVDETVSDTTSPTFTSSNTASANENQTSAITVVAIDDISVVTYSIEDGDDADSFDIDSATGVVTFKVAPNYEAMPEKLTYTFTAVATDASTNEATQTITITIVDLNEEAPLFISSDTADAIENRTTAITVEATDSTSVVTYSICEGLMDDGLSFNIDESTGVVTFKIAPDYEAVPEKRTYTLRVRAANLSANETTQDITITILDEEIVNNGSSYETVLSPYTGKVWLDRNLGASQVCTAIDDANCYGDYYQWGRKYDGHENDSSPTTTTQAISPLSIGHTRFIVYENLSTNDWARDSDRLGAIRLVSWLSMTDNPTCPSGYRVPSIVELENETTDVDNSIDAFNSFLILPSAGYRKGDGTMHLVGSIARLWTGTLDDTLSYGMTFFEYTKSSSGASRIFGYSVRCIKGSIF